MCFSSMEGVREDQEVSEKKKYKASRKSGGCVCVCVLDVHLNVNIHLQPSNFWSAAGTWTRKPHSKHHHRYYLSNVCEEKREVCLPSAFRQVFFRSEMTKASPRTWFIMLASSWRRGHVSRIRRTSGEFKAVLESTSVSIRRSRFTCNECKEFGNEWTYDWLP